MDRISKWLLGGMIGGLGLSSVAFNFFFVSPEPIRSAPESIQMIPFYISLFAFAVGVVCMYYYFKLQARPL